MLHVDWYLKGHVILAEVSGDIEIDDVADLNDQIIALIDTSQTAVHLIIDVTNLGRTPTHLLKLREASHALGNEHVGWIIMVGLQNPFVNFLGSMLTQLGRMSRYRVMTSVDEAYAYLRQADNQLQPK